MSKPSGLPGRWIWIALVLVLAVLAVVRVLAEQETALPGVDQRFFVHARWVVGLVVALAVAMLTLVTRAEGESGSQRGLDRAFMMLALSWVISSASVAAMSLGRADTPAVLFRHLAYQFSVACSLHFLCATVGRRVPVAWGLVLAQLLLAWWLLAWGYLDPAHRHWSFAGWRIANVVGFTAVLLVLCRALLRGGRQPPWLPLGACLMGFGLGLSDMASVDGSSIPVSATHNVFSAYLLMVWLLLTRRIGERQAPHGPQEHSEHSILGAEFAHTDLDESLVAGESSADVAETATSRRRIAQELHDGVGSQLVNILASLDRSVPQQRSMADALEQCLLDVKILVDDIDSTQECVLDALARLRYRVQASLDRLGIRLRWELHDDPALQAVRGDPGRQVLRITQESLANVMRHSRARNVCVSCRYSHEANAALIEITDDGVGFDSRLTDGNRGKGLQGMRRRAASVRADLLVRSQPGRGTNIRLSLPLNLRAPAAVRENFPTASTLL